MTEGQLREVLCNVTEGAKLRIWYADNDAFWKPLDEAGGHLSHDYSNLHEPEGIEEDAIRHGVALDLTCKATDDVDIEVELSRPDKGDSLFFFGDQLRGIHHIAVLEAGCAPSETIDFGHHHNFEANPARDYVSYGGAEVPQQSIQELYDGLGRWLEHRKQAV